MNSSCRELPFRVAPGHLLALAVDTLNRGVHFPVTTSADAIAWKAIAVNLSDMAAMGAAPLFCSVHLYHDGDNAFVQEFTSGCERISQACQVPFMLDMVAAADLSVTVQVYGQVPENQALRRDGAGVGDRVYVSGTLGDAALALTNSNLSATDRAYVQQRLDRPQPRLSLGEELRGIASSAIDISDGLLADLGHILDASGVGARVQVEQVPLSAALHSLVDRDRAWQLALTGGDDYELCFTVPVAKAAALQSLAAGPSITCIGEITSDRGLQLVDSSGQAVTVERPGYEHFTGESHGG